MNVDLLRIFIAWPMLSGFPLFIAFGHLLKRAGLEREDLILPAVVLAILAGLLLACLRLNWLERARGRMLAAQPIPRNDGAYLAAGGRLRDSAEPLISPLHGTGCGLHAWSIGLRKKQQREAVIGRGVALADAALDSPQGLLPLQGIPEVEEVEWHRSEDPAVLARLARVILGRGTDGLEAPTGAAALSIARMQPQAAILQTAGIDQHDGVRWGCFDITELPVIPWDTLRAQFAAGDQDSAARQLAECLHAADCIIYVSALPVGAEVTVVGRWRAGRLVIGAGLGERWHGLIGLATSVIATRAARRTRHALLAAIGLGFALAAVLGVAILPR